MLAINHALTGALIGISVGEPVLALPAAFLSHYLCDALPHFGSTMPIKKWLRTKTFLRLLISDAVLCIALVLALALLQPNHWLLASACAFVATVPDIFWINQFITAKRGKTWKPNVFSRFSRDIQWFERPIGSVVELAWAVAALSVLSIFVA